ncbi:hypothetical protein IMZ31_24105 (plasmid) [Pontibacillus sp. ALD_SL1]|uniref:hypothetical protein n=1 Tax=Pontibacillus sp. ALD_SL1 TaxID=2777185 RepID=UPI001A97A62B|nr:hypothetical protein [Pontibacillus sp. ALD_SL1]QST02536.1 hypothetical protein IMZ31_24105 [Pontibacillus sp. ALD_SL1]
MLDHWRKAFLINMIEELKESPDEESETLGKEAEEHAHQNGTEEALSFLFQLSYLSDEVRECLGKGFTETVESISYEHAVSRFGPAADSHYTSSFASYGPITYEGSFVPRCCIEFDGLVYPITLQMSLEDLLDDDAFQRHLRFVKVQTDQNLRLEVS